MTTTTTNVVQLFLTMTVLLLLLLLSSILTVTTAFVPIISTRRTFIPTTTTTTTTTTTRIRSTIVSDDTVVGIGASNDHIIKSGGGIPIIPSGNRLLFDPAREGKIGDAINDRIEYGINYQLPIQLDLPSSFEDVSFVETQHWLEDIGVPQNSVKPTKPVTATVLGRARVISDDAPGDIQHIVLQTPQDFHYVEGQSIYVIPPGMDTKSGKAHKPRLYSIASTRYGDLLDGNTVSLCVRRAEYTDPSTGQVDPTKAGVCSTFLCTTQPGDVVPIAGPVGKTMLLPEDSTKDLIFVATGTGIAPFRSFLHRLFMEQTVHRHLFTGKVWLILGVPTSGSLLYKDEFDSMVQNVQYPGQLHISYAISREMVNSRGTKLYVQDILQENADLLFDQLDNGANIYFCGLKSMMPSIFDTLQTVATQRNIDWTTKYQQLLTNHQFHVEVY